MKDLRDRAIENGLIDEEGNHLFGDAPQPWAPSESIDALRVYVREIRRECQDLPIGVPKALDMIVDELVRLNDLCHETALRVGG